MAGCNTLVLTKFVAAVGTMNIALPNISADKKMLKLLLKSGTKAASLTFKFVQAIARLARAFYRTRRHI